MVLRLRHVAFEALDLRFRSTCARATARCSSTSSRAIPDVEVAHRRRTRASLRGRRARPRGRPRWRCFASKPRSRPAIARLATRRLTSHSHGPGSVSSKSLMSNTSRRSGDGEAAEVGEVRVAAALHLAARMRGVRRQVGRHDRGRAPVERERRHEHPPVPQRHQLGHPAARLLLSSSTGSRRSAAGSQSPCSERGARVRAAFPTAFRSATVGGWHLLPAWVALHCAWVLEPECSPWDRPPGYQFAGLFGRPRVMCPSSSTPAHMPSGIWAEGEAPGCARAIRTRRTAGRMRKRSGGSSMQRLAIDSGGDGRIGVDLKARCRPLAPGPPPRPVVLAAP